MCRNLWSVIGILLGCLGALRAESQDPEWKVGLARVKITPEQPVFMAGYAARDKPSQGQMTELWAKALAIEDPAGKRVVLITLDLVGIDHDVSKSTCEKLQGKFLLDRSQIAINCSHTHSGPVVAHNLRPMHEYSLERDQQELIRRYAQKLEQSIVDVVGLWG